MYVINRVGVNYGDDCLMQNFVQIQISHKVKKEISD